jgi:endoglucanase
MVAYQVQVPPGTALTDADAMQINGLGIAADLLRVPLRYMQTPCEVLSLEDVENCARLMAAYCRWLTPETSFKPW